MKIDNDDDVVVDDDDDDHDHDKGYIDDDPQLYLFLQ